MSDQKTNTQNGEMSAENTETKGASTEEQNAPENGAQAPENASKDDGVKDEAKQSAAKYTDEDLNNIIAKKRREWEAKAKEAADEAAKLAGMNAEEKAQHEREKAERRAEEAERELARLKMADTAKTMLAEAKIGHVGDAMLQALIGPDAETTKDNIDVFVEQYTAAVEAEVKERLKGTTPKAGQGTGAKTITREEIAAIKDPTERRRLIAENLHLYE